MRSLILMALGLALAACSAEPTQPGEVAPNAALREAVTKGPPAPARPTRFGYDEHGRLRPAKDLVSGFEVPEGVKLLRSQPEFLVFEHTASPQELAEFWSGGDKRDGHRVSERRYEVLPGKRGFEVRHTDSNLERLSLDGRYRDAHLFVTPGGGRQELIRVHLPPEDPAAASRRFLSPVNDEHPGQAPVGGNAPPPATTPGGNPPPAPESPANNAPTAPAPTPSVTPTLGPAPPRFPVPGRAKRPVIDKVRTWKINHPGETFLD